MVSVSQARAQLVTQREIVESQRQSIQQISLPTLTAAQVRQQTRQTIITRGQQGEELQRLKTVEIKKLDPFIKDLDKFESQIINVETQLKQQKERQAAFRKALDVFFKVQPTKEFPQGRDPRALFFLSGLEEEFFRKIVQGKTTAIRLQIEKAIKEIEEKGLKAVPVFEEGKLVAFKGELLPEKVKIDIGIPRPKAILAPGELPPGIPAEPPSKIKTFLRKIEKRIPIDPKGIIGLLELERRVVKAPVTPRELLVPPSDIVTADIRPFVPTGAGTVIVTPREKTFFERNNIDPRSPSSIKLLEDVQRIEGEFENELISEAVANKRLETASEDFTRSQIKEGIPRDLAAGVAFGIIASLPIIGIPAQIALAGDLLLKRREIAKQFSQFPGATSASFAAFAVGGIIGSRIGIKVRLPKTPDLVNLKSGIILSAKQVTKLSKTAAEIDPGFRIAIEQGKITETSASRITTADGRVFEILQFTKVKGPSLDPKAVLRGATEFIGFEVRPKGAPGEVILGRAAQVLTDSKGEAFIGALRLQLPRTPIGRLAQKFVGGKGEFITIAQITKATGVTPLGFGRTRISFRTETGVIKVSPAKASLIRRSLRVIDQIKKGRKINLSLIKSLINIQKRLDGEKPFTSKEFADSTLKTLTDSQLLTILRKLSGTAIVEIKPGFVALALKGKAKEEIVGVAVTLPKIEAPKLKIKKTPLESTFDVKKPSFLIPKIKGLKDKLGRFKESKLVTADKNKATQEPFKSGVTQIVRVPSRDPFPLEEIPTRFPPGSLTPGIALALAKPLRPFQPSITALRAKTTFGEVLSTQTLTIQITSLKNALQTAQQTRLDLKQISSPSQFIQNRLKNLQKTIQFQKLKITQFQRLRRFTRLVPTRTIKITGGGERVFLRPSPTELLKKKKKLFAPPVPISRIGYNVFVKSRGKFKKVNIRPIRKRKALDLGAFVTDQSLAATYKISKTNMKANPPKIKFPKGYFLRTNKKFRVKLVKGKPIKNLAIEKRKFRLDTLREVNKIQAARFIAQLRKNTFKKIKPIKFKRV